ncbi:MAG: DUF2894 domain-containing protein [Thauera sp.]|jgi:hypothetical protein|nr:DUF2894 domain-containing protein [Thauera sp.]
MAEMAMRGARPTDRTGNHPQLVLAADVLAGLERRGAGLQGVAQLAWARRVQQRREALAQLQTDAGRASVCATRHSQSSPFPALLAQLGSTPQAERSPVPATPLKAVRLFASQWEQLRLEARLAAALAGGPVDAGPLNSHHLIVQSLRRLQVESPAYLQHFLAWGEALLRLEQQLEPVGGRVESASAAEGTRRSGAKPRKTSAKQVRKPRSE